MNMSPGDEAYVAGSLSDYDDALRDFFVNAPQMWDDAWVEASDHAQSLRTDLAGFFSDLRLSTTAPKTVADTEAAWSSAHDKLMQLCNHAVVEHFPASGINWQGRAASEYRAIFTRHAEALGKLAAAVDGIANALKEIEEARDKRSSDLADLRRTQWSIVGASASGILSVVAGGGSALVWGSAESDTIDSDYEGVVLAQIQQLKQAVELLPDPWPRFDGNLDGHE